MASSPPYLKPLPDITAQNLPFWEALRRHEFLVPRCAKCRDYNWTPYPACRTCLSEDQVWTKVSGEATVFSYTIVHRGPGVFQDEVPYVVVLAELVEQPRPMLVLGNVTGCPPEAVGIGQRVRMAFDDIDEENVTLWHFVPSGVEGRV